MAFCPSATMGQRLRQARTALAVSEDFVAATLGLSVDSYRSIESGAAGLSPGNVIRAAQLFGVHPSSLCIDLGADAPQEPKPETSAANVVDLASARDAARLRRTNQ